MEKTTIELWEWAESIAKTLSGGHLTIFKFTTNYKGFFGTPPLGNLRYMLERTHGFKTLDELLTAMINSPENFQA